MPKKQDKLKPCPFCGSNDVSLFLPEFNHIIVCIQCVECSAHGGKETSDKAAIRAWNLRKINRLTLTERTK